VTISAYVAMFVTGTLAAYRSAGVLRVWLAYDVAMTVGMKLYTALATNREAANHAYKLAWMAAEPIGIVLAGCVALSIAKPRWWIAAPALVVHFCAAGYPRKFPGSWLECEVHAVAFCCLLFGLTLLAEFLSQLPANNALALATDNCTVRATVPQPVDLPPTPRGPLNETPQEWHQRVLSALRACYDLAWHALKDCAFNRHLSILSVLFLATAAAYYPAIWHPAVRQWLMWEQAGCYLLLAVSSRGGSFSKIRHRRRMPLDRQGTLSS